MLSAIQVPSSVEEIGVRAFKDCIQLASVVLKGESQPQKICPNAFENCYHLTELALLDSHLTEIGANAFKSCINLQSICLPATLETIGERAFADCTYLNTITFEQGSALCTIDACAFLKCLSLKTVCLPTPVKQLMEGAFLGCSNLHSETFAPGSTLREIQELAFSGTKLQSITIPASVTDIGGSAFFKCPLEKVFFETGSQLCAIPQSFCNHSPLKEISIPASVEKISQEAFRDCLNLNKVTFELGSNLKEIGPKAFGNCTSLRAIQVPFSVQEICDSAFQDCSQLTCVVLGNGSHLQKICPNAFKNCPLEKLVLPENVEIAREAFANAHCSICLYESSIPFLRYQNRPGESGRDEEGFFLWLNDLFGRYPTDQCKGNKVTIIKQDGGEETWEFTNVKQKEWTCTDGRKMDPSTKFQSIINEKGETIIIHVENLYRQLTNDKTVIRINTVPQWLFTPLQNREYYRDYCCEAVYRDNPRYLKVEFDDEVKAIPELIFHSKRAGALTNGILPREIFFSESSKLEHLGVAAFCACFPLQKINIPQEVKKLEEGLFFGCPNLKQIDFSPTSKLEIIGPEVFHGCRLNSITIPPHVTQIDKFAFVFCRWLTSVTFSGKNIQEISPSAFECCTALANVVIPCRDFAHFVGSGFKNVLLPSVTNLEISLDNLPSETEIRQFLTEHCGKVDGRIVTVKGDNRGETAFKCEGGQWNRA
jgi:Leucine-rich repeat (LRR) protein